MRRYRGGEGCEAILFLAYVVYSIVSTWPWISLAVIGGCVAAALAWRWFSRKSGQDPVGSSFPFRIARPRGTRPARRTISRRRDADEGASPPLVFDASDTEAISAAEGRFAVVSGTVESVHPARSGKVTYIYFFRGYYGFKGVIFPEAVTAFEGRFGDLGALSGQIVYLRGTIGSYDRLPQIILRDPSQISLEGWAAETPGRVPPAEDASLEPASASPPPVGGAIDTTAEPPDSEPLEENEPPPERWSEEAWAALWYTIFIGVMAEGVRWLVWLPRMVNAEPLPSDIKFGMPSLLLTTAVAWFVAWKNGRPLPTLR